MKVAPGAKPPEYQSCSRGAEPDPLTGLCNQSELRSGLRKSIRSVRCSTAAPESPPRHERLQGRGAASRGRTPLVLHPRWRHQPVTTSQLMFSAFTFIISTLAWPRPLPADPHEKNSWNTPPAPPKCRSMFAGGRKLLMEVTAEINHVTGNNR